MCSIVLAGTSVHPAVSMVTGWVDSLVSIKDSSNFVCIVLLYSYGATISGRGFLLSDRAYEAKPVTASRDAFDVPEVLSMLKNAKP